MPLSENVRTSREENPSPCTGCGWCGARRNLEETFNAMEHLNNIADMEAGFFRKLFR